ncbi:MAG: hypothetical protein IGBAC_0588 [Ignavibacteriae bacterium]|nr:MAG: hypothetical protein IGBAC_0588 [Ignavibacteriota bacterium]
MEFLTFFVCYTGEFKLIIKKEKESKRLPKTKISAFLSK